MTNLESGVPTRVIGVDACRKGWVGITSDVTAHFGRTVQELIERADLDGRVQVVAIDIPIGLPDDGARAADRCARSFLSPGTSVVFPIPVRDALLAETYELGSSIMRARTGRGLTRQAYGLRAKILEVDSWVRLAGRTVIEVHPEVSFKSMAKRRLAHPKKTWAGAAERHALLGAHGMPLPLDIGAAGEVAGIDDVLDAAAAAWTAERYARGEARPFPSKPETFSDGWPCAIWA